MGFEKIDRGEYFEGVFACDHIDCYISKCERCGTIIDTPNMTRIEKCYKCGHEKVSPPKPKKCNYKSRTALSKIDSEGNKVRKTDDKQIKEFYKVDPDKLAGGN